MATITEDYCDFETAKLLKEKGFVIPLPKDWVFCMYDESGNTQWGCYHSDWYPRITLQMAMKWLREVHKISIEITSTGYLIDNDVEWECDIKIGHRLYFRHITNEKSFESCAEAAIKYCLKNLI